MNELHLSLALDSPIIQSRVCALPQDYVGPTRCESPKALAVPKGKSRKYECSWNKRCCVSDMSYIGQCQSSFENGLPFEEVRCTPLGKLSTRLLVQCCTRLLPLHTAPSQCHGTGEDAPH